MPKYTVVHTPLRHGRKGEKKAKTYNLGDEIVLTEDEAALIGDNVEAVSKSKPQSDKK